MSKFWLVTLPRVTLGAVFLLGAIDGFAFIATGAHLLHPPTSARGLQFEAALKSTGFFWPLMKTVELIGAACLLTNRAPAFGLALLAPVITVVVLFHGLLNPQGLPLAGLLVVSGALLLRAYAGSYAGLFRRASPRPASVGRAANVLSRQDRLLLRGMHERDLADMGVSRSDLPRLYAGSDFRRQLGSVGPLDATPVPATGTSLSFVRGLGLHGAIIKTSAAVSAGLVTWAIFHGIAPNGSLGVSQAAYRVLGNSS